MGWRYIFVDESGDPGSQSPFFVAAAVDCPAEAFETIRRLTAPYRHHFGLAKEVKAASLLSHKKSRQMACEMLSALTDHDVHGTVVHLDKQSYDGPYLGTTGMKPWPQRFRNFVLRLLVEKHFNEFPVGDGTLLELVFDRVSLPRSDRNELERYLSTKAAIPPVEYFTHVDSEYAEPIMWPDLAVTIVKEFLAGEPEPDHAASLRALLHCVDITHPYK
jgi:hypothetical protein